MVEQYPRLVLKNLPGEIPRKTTVGKNVLSELRMLGCKEWGLTRLKKVNVYVLNAVLGEARYWKVGRLSYLTSV